MNIPKTLWSLSRLKGNEKISPARMRALQEAKLRRLLRHAHAHSPYYREVFEAAGITAEKLDNTPLSQFPTLDKATLLARFDQVVTVPDLRQEELRRFDQEEKPDRRPFLGKYHVVHSSGSTGRPGYFVYDEEAWGTMLLGIIRGALWGMGMPQILGLLAGRPRILYLAATDGRYGGTMAVGDGIDGVGARQLHLDIKTPLSQWARQVREFQPTLVIGYPSAIKILAELAEQGGVTLGVRRVVCCGEPLGAGLRRYLEKTLGAEVVNFYGASESLAMGVETDPSQGMLLFDDLNLIEVEDGAMYLTCLYNFVQPLIRYRLSDSLTVERPKENGSCPFSRATGLLGRSGDVLWFEDGAGRREFLHPLAIEGFCVQGLLDYQFMQTARDAFEMRAQTSEQADREAVRAGIQRQMGEILGEKGLSYVRFGVGFVEEIPPDPRTGKKRLILEPEEEGGRPG